MKELSGSGPTDQWHNLVQFAIRNDIPVLRVTPAQHRAIKQLPWVEHGFGRPYHPARGDGGRPELFGFPLEEVPENSGLDLASAVAESSLGESRVRDEEKE